MQICFTTFYQERRTKINRTSISNIFEPCASHFFFFTLGSLSTEDRHSNKFRLATLQVYPAVLIQSEGKYELEWLKQFNADKDERFI